EALAIAMQIAEAIEAAHEKGVIHRDLKPANIKFTSDDQVKVLDFGLAKSFEMQSFTDTEIANSPTMVAPGSPTITGVILGTAGYLSPEQARGRPADKRTDIFSFGCLLYEMLTGRMTFAGETTSDMIAKILQRDPDFDALPDTTPPDIRHLLRRCLAKDPKHRLRDIGDARLELEESDAGLPEVAVDPRRPGVSEPVHVVPKPSSRKWVAVTARGGRWTHAVQGGAGQRLPWLLVVVLLGIVGVSRLPVDPARRRRGRFGQVHQHCQRFPRGRLLPHRPGHRPDPGTGDPEPPGRGANHRWLL
ncbi:MAG: serine/threonine protein kinase, partial [Planctomycetes bacterium]|nr:serine/threonine protein kinase [Planctomycetota bacterium]